MVKSGMLEIFSSGGIDSPVKGLKPEYSNYFLSLFLFFLEQKRIIAKSECYI